MSEIESKPAKQVSGDIELIEIISLLWEKRKLIAAVTGAFTLVGIIYAFFIAIPMYKSTITLYQTNQELNAKSRLESMAAQFGIGGLGSPNNDYNIVDVVKSTTLSKMIIQRKWKTNDSDDPVSLIDYWEIKGKTPYIRFMKAIERMKEQIFTNINDETGLISVSVLAQEPSLASDIVNFIGKEIQKYVQKKQKKEGERNRKFIEGRLKIAESELEQAEDALEKFLSKNIIISESPYLQIELARLKRKVQINQEVYISLHKQLEIALIEEVRNAKVVNILDFGEKPIKKAKPKRAFIIVAFMMTAFILAVLILFLISLFKNYRID